MRALALSMTLATLLPLQPLLAAEQATLTVTGEGRVSAVPDMAVVQVGVERRGEDAGAAMDAVSLTMGELMAVLADEGIPARDIRSSSLSLDLVYRGSAPARAAEGDYSARSTLSVTLRDMSRPGEVLQALLEAGANSFGGLSFSVQAPRPLEDEARQLAVADARARGELYAEAAGVTLGPIQSISEGGGRVSPMAGMARMAASPEAMPLAAGETEVSASVTIVWEIAEE